MFAYRSIVAVAFVFSSIAASAQDLTALVSRYDSVAFYPDSTIKGLYHLRKGLPNGVAIEFSEKGTPTDIGEFKRGQRHGVWISSDGHSVKYKKGERLWGGYPGCGTGWRKAKATFQERYTELCQQQ